MGRQRQNLLLPVVVAGLLDQSVGIGFELQLRSQAGLQGVAAQGAVAEAMDGGDVSGIEVFKGE